MWGFMNIWGFFLDGERAIENLLKGLVMCFKIMTGSVLDVGLEGDNTGDKAHLSRRTLLETFT